MVLLLNGFAGSYAGWLKTFPFCNAAVYSEKDTFVKNVETKKNNGANCKHCILKTKYHY